MRSRPKNSARHPSGRRSCITGWASSGVIGMMPLSPHWVSIVASETSGSPAMIRCIWGPMWFRPVPLDSCWLCWNNGTVDNLAQSIYSERAFDQLPILADALEDAGCRMPISWPTVAAAFMSTAAGC